VIAIKLSIVCLSGISGKRERQGDKESLTKMKNYDSMTSGRLNVRASRGVNEKNEDAFREIQRVRACQNREKTGQESRAIQTGDLREPSGQPEGSRQGHTPQSKPHGWREAGSLTRKIVKLAKGGETYQKRLF
jgi:hypothetical protein